jgi:hypothetical protein
MATLKELMALKKSQIAESSGKRTQTVKPSMGSTRFRILPSWRGADSQFYHDFGQHFIRTSPDVKPIVYVCVEKTFNKPCIICDGLRDGFHTAKDDASKKLIKDCFASSRILLNALEIDKDKSTPVILELSPTTFDKVIDIIQQNADADNEDFNIVTDMENGVDIIITRSGTGLGTEYGVQPALKGSVAVSQSVLAKLNNLDQFVAQEQELALLKASNAVQQAVGNVAKALPLVSSKDIEFDDDDVPYHASPDVIESTSSYVKSEKLSDDELNLMLDELDD